MTAFERWQRRLTADSSGQDAVEYALLAAVVGLAGVIALNALSATMGSVYKSRNATINSLWEPPGPADGG